MVSKIKSLPQQDKEGALEKEDRETVADSPLAGLSDAAVQLIRSAKKRGYVTHDQINSVLPSEEGQFQADRGCPRHVQRDGCQRSRDRGERRGRGAARGVRRRG